MNRINNNFNINYIWENGIKYISKEQLEKLSEREKFIGCKCGKPREFRWKESSLSRHEVKGLYYGIKPFKGRNNEELCHKCAFCAKCGKKEAYLTGGESCCKSEKTNDNPTGEWVLAHCSVDCFHGTEKPSLPKEEVREGKNCNYCGKLTQVKFGNTNTGEIFCSRDCFVAAGNKIQKGKCRIAGCSREAYYECMDLCLSHSKPCQGTHMGKRCNLALGSDEGNFCERCQKDNKENSPSPNPAAPAPQITNENSESDNSVKVNPGNSPQPNPGKDNQSETKNDNKVKTIRFENKENEGKNDSTNPVENSPNKTDNETLIINLKEIKKITLSGGNLIIEFDNKQESNHWYSISQTITPDQIKNNQELQTVKNYLEKNNQNSLSHQELNKLLSKDKQAVSPEKPKDNNLLLIGGIAGGTLIIGVVIGLFLRRKKRVKKVN